MLKMRRIDARFFGDLSDIERREIEMEENERTKTGGAIDAESDYVVETATGGDGVFGEKPGGYHGLPGIAGRVAV